MKGGARVPAAPGVLFYRFGAGAAQDALRGQDAARGEHLTARYSPGYGDFGLAVQADIVRLLDLPRAIGVAAAPGGALSPQKSITAVPGAADVPDVPGAGAVQRLEKTGGGLAVEIHGGEGRAWSFSLPGAGARRASKRNRCAGVWAGKCRHTAPLPPKPAACRKGARAKPAA